MNTVQYDENAYTYLIEGLSVDTSGHWRQWEWNKVRPWTSYNMARLEEYRDSVIVTYRLYNRIGLEHVRKMLTAVPRDAKLLDAGGGTGRKTIPLAQDGFTDITILDIAPEWLRLADEKARKVGVRDRLKLVEGNILDMRDFADGSFDYVFAMGGVVSSCGDAQKAVCEMARLLKPGGKLLADGIHNRFLGMHYAAHSGNLDALEELAHPSGVSQRTSFFLPEEVEELAHQADLTDVHVEAEGIFEPDNEIRVGPDTERWEKVILELEMRYHSDPRFLGTAGLMLRAMK